jgi:hypothetical protein
LAFVVPEGSFLNGFSRLREKLVPRHEVGPLPSLTKLDRQTDRNFLAFRPIYFHSIGKKNRTDAKNRIRFLPVHVNRYLSFRPKIFLENTQKSNFHFGQKFHPLFQPKI